jgi:uncharacterized protein YjbI with pentapeptide repeats
MRFENCLLRNADFYEAKFNKLEFKDCDLNDANFTGTRLKGVDLSTCKFNHLNLSLDSVAGCIVSADQAIGFARLLGLEIKD